MENSVSFFKKKMPLRVCGALGIVIFSLLMICTMIDRMDIDLYYIVATGREIVKNGFPHENVWHIDRPGGFIVQQWLYCVIAYFLDSLPIWSYTVFTSLQVLLLAYLSYVFLKTRGLSGSKACITIVFALFVDCIYIFAHRPEAITLILLMTECIGFEKFRWTKKSLYLVLLPVSIVLEMNFHAAMWMVHYAILAAYFVPAFYFRRADDVSIHNAWKKVLPYVIAMTLSMLINPYGFDGIAHAVKSLVSGVFSKLDIYEMNMPQIASPATGLLIIVVFFMFFVFKFGKIDSVALNIIVGFTLMSFMAYRHIMFSYFTVIFVASAFLQVDSLVKKIDLQKDLYNYYYVPIAAVLLISSVSLISSVVKTSKVGIGNLVKDDSPSMHAILNYFDENNVDKHTHIFTSDSGSYMEYFGYDNIYLDTRWEFYSDVFTGDIDYVDEFYAHCSNGVTNVTPLESVQNKRSYIIDDTAMKQWIDKYDFEYFIVRIDSIYLNGYLAGSPDYELVDIGNRCDDGRYLADTGMGYMLFKRVD